jgi:uncharacterized sulfatase
VKSSTVFRAAKGHLYEGGVRVPLIVWGAGVDAGVSDDLVLSTDLYATICELAGVPVPLEALDEDLGGSGDSISFASILTGGPGARETAIVELALPTGGPPWRDYHRRAAIGTRWKLIRRRGKSGAQSAELFDLAEDPGETTNLLEKPLEDEAQRAFDELSAVLRKRAG